MYRQIADDLRAKIESGEIAPGTRLPTEIELRDEYRASRNTIRDAIRFLTTRGLVETRPGQGTFATQRAELFTVRLGDPGWDSPFLPELLGAQKFEASRPTVEVSYSIPEIRRELLLSEGSQIISRHHQRYIGSIPWSLQTSFYLMQLVHAGATRLLAAEELERGAVQYIEETLGITQVGWSERLHVRPPEEGEARFLNLPDDGRIPVIVSTRTAYDQHGVPFCVTVTVYPTDRNQFVFAGGEVPARPVGWAVEELDTAQDRMKEARAGAAIALER
jgi:GntR family transcriptional regulator